MLPYPGVHLGTKTSELTLESAGLSAVSHHSGTRLPIFILVLGKFSPIRSFASTNSFSECVTPRTRIEEAMHGQHQVDYDGQLGLLVVSASFT